MALAVVGVIFLAQPLLLIFAGIVFAAMLDGGTRLLGRVLPIGRGWRLLIVTLAGVGFIVWTIYFAGVQLAGQAARLRDIVTVQVNRMLAWAQRLWAWSRAASTSQQLCEPADGLARPARLGGVAARWARSPSWS